MKGLHITIWAFALVFLCCASQAQEEANPKVLTVGGGAQTSSLMFDGRSGDWTAESKAVFHKQGFMALTPFIGCDFIATKFLHITLKADWMTTITDKKLLGPTGPRFYVGLIFYH